MSRSPSTSWRSAKRADHIVLISGDGDFRRLIEAVQAQGVRVTVISTIRTQPPMIADELRRQADLFVDLVDLQPLDCPGCTGRRPLAAERDLEDDELEDYCLKEEFDDAEPE